ncbi:hypothetical protein SISSUDRAFT_1064078 [Sistotremastrum suecicum HHB10207 ss-3]|uniref:Uncharacterized protein n=1 Tax=Sistotremastrum suecicum HHB10207 ss-3 TaxID=1314776 RepID=A0A166B361_9AGAM|nr:hypothetical protein SISSUDRAFT_1064078 [Sistotremastrum suecicum HHB10207 ss-3]
MAARLVQVVAAVSALGPERWRRNNYGPGLPVTTSTTTGTAGSAAPTDSTALYTTRSAGHAYDDRDGSNSRHYDYGATNTTNHDTERRRSASRDPLLTIEEDAESICSSLQDKDDPPQSYNSMILKYSFVPLSSLVVFLALILIFTLALHGPSGSKLCFTTILLCIFSSIAAWTTAHTLRLPIYTLASYLSFRRGSAPIILISSTFIQVLLAESLRVGLFIILQLHLSSEKATPSPPEDAFARSCWIALGWAIAEVTVGVVQGYQQLFLYQEESGDERTVLVGLEDSGAVYFTSEHEQQVESPVVFTNQAREEGHGSRRSSPAGSMSLPEYIHEELDHLMALKQRAELEEVYGSPITACPLLFPNLNGLTKLQDIPVFISCLQRIDSIILSLGLTLLLSASYTLHPFLHDHPSHPHEHPLHPPSNIIKIIPTFGVVVLLHTVLSLLWTPVVLPRIGIHSASYIALVGALGSLWAGLWMWGILE